MRKVSILLNVILIIGFTCMTIYYFGIEKYVNFCLSVFCSICWSICFVLNTKMGIDDTRERTSIKKNN